MKLKTISTALKCIDFALTSGLDHDMLSQREYNALTDAYDELKLHKKLSKHFTFSHQNIWKWDGDSDVFLRVPSESVKGQKYCLYENRYEGAVFTGKSPKDCLEQYEQHLFQEDCC